MHGAGHRSTLFPSQAQRQVYKDSRTSVCAGEWKLSAERPARRVAGVNCTHKRQFEKNPADVQQACFSD